jgi:hypothetical protein
MWWCGLQTGKVGCWKHSSELSCSIKHEDFLNYLRNYELLKTDLPHAVSCLAGWLVAGLLALMDLIFLMNPAPKFCNTYLHIMIFTIWWPNPL